MRGRGQQLMTAGVMTGTTSITSAPFWVDRYEQSSIQERHTGTPTGVITLECSINFDRTTGVGDWFTVTLEDAITSPAGAAGGQGIDLSGIPYPWARLKYTNTSGTGVLDVWAYGRGTAE